MAAILTSISPDRPSDAISTLLTVMVQHAGGDFVAVQDAWLEYGLPPYVLFNHPKHRATLAIRLDENFSNECDSQAPGRVRKEIW